MSTKKVQEAVSHRHELVQIEEFCPLRPYVELTVPQDASAIISASFTTVSRDQGYADIKNSASYTWFEIGLRHGNRSRTEIGVVRIHSNRVANDEFFEATTTWNSGPDETLLTMWLQALQPGDTIQIIPRATYPGWVNIVKEARIRIEYLLVGTGTEAKATEKKPLPLWRYDTLSSKSRQIRLLVVQPAASRDDPIEASFEYRNLLNPSISDKDFEALSYCWGLSTDRVALPIKQPGFKKISSIYVTRAVDKALRELRQNDSPLRIWIDSVCINQDDMEEKAQQVGMMGMIYSNASTVHVWLDDTKLGLDLALRVVRDIYNHRERVCPGGGLCSCRGTKHWIRVDDERFAKEADNASYGHLWEIFDDHCIKRHISASALEAAGGKGSRHLSQLMQNFFEHPYFQRVWVVQEVILSKKALVHYGSEMVEWKEIALVDELLNLNLYRAQSPSVRGQWTLPTIWKTLSVVRKETPSMLDVLLSALEMKATEPRDKLFSLLPFGRETQTAVPPELQPDYKKPFERVMTDFTRWWIRENRSLDILSFVHCHAARAWQRTQHDHTSGQSAASQKTTPSWVIELDGYSRWQSMTLIRQFSFQVSGHRKPDEKLLEVGDHDPLALRLRGFEIATLVAIEHPPAEMVYPNSDRTKGSLGKSDADLSLVFNHMFDPCGFTRMWSHPMTDEADEKESQANLYQEFRRHVAAHSHYIAEELPYAILPNGKDGSYTSHPQGNSRIPKCIDRCYFVTSNGLYGLCPWMAKTGDVIVVLDGGRVPYLLRPAAVHGDRNSGKEIGPMFEFVGECFIDGGFMKGEVTAETSEVFTLV